MTRRQRGWTLVFLAVGLLAAGTVIGHPRPSRVSTQLHAAETELRSAYAHLNVEALHQRYAIASVTDDGSGSGGDGVFPTTARTELFRASFPTQSSLRAIYTVDDDSSHICVIVSAQDQPAMVRIKVAPCS